MRIGKHEQFLAFFIGSGSCLGVIIRSFSLNQLAINETH